MLGAVTVGMMFVGGVPISGLFRIGGLAMALGMGIYGVGKVSPEMFPRFGTWTNRIEQHIGFTTGGADHVATEGEYQIELAQVAIQRRIVSIRSWNRNIEELSTSPIFRYDLCIYHRGMGGNNWRIRIVTYLLDFPL